MTSKEEGKSSRENDISGNVFSRLRFFNSGMGVLHLVQGIAVLLLSSNFSLPVTTSYLQFVLATTSLEQNLNMLGQLRIGPMVAVFFFLSAFAHFFVSTVGFKTYKRDLKNSLNRFRWYEYSLSASLMIVIIAMLTGVYDLSALILIFFVNAAMILFGMAMELYSKPGKSADWRPFIYGSIMGIMPWVIIALHLFGAEATAETSIPTFVYAIFGSLFVFFNIFAVNMVLQYKKVGKWEDYLFGERVYILLSLVAKSLLAWQVFAGTLRPM